MSDNPTEVESPVLPLSSYRVLALTGRDAVTFAQAQTMNDVSLLADGAWHWNGWLSAKGRVIALFALLRLDAETLWMLLPDHAPAELADALKKYVFRSKVTLTPREDLQVSGAWDAASIADPRAFTQGHDGSVSLAWPGNRRIDIRPLPVAHVTEAHGGTTVHWHQTDLVCGIPRLDASQASQWTPQQLSLERLQAFSVKKGCYPGQEIVARTHFLGQAKRGLALLDTQSPACLGDEVISENRSIGQVIASRGNVALAVLPLEAADAAPLMVGDQIVTRRPFAPV